MGVYKITKALELSILIYLIYWCIYAKMSVENRIKVDLDINQKVNS